MIFDSIEVSDEVKRQVDHSFAIVDQIHAILESKGMTQRDLAILLEKRESEVSKWMRGTHNFTLKSISKLEVVLGESIIITPNQANKEYSSLKMIPVVVYANINRPVVKEKVTTQQTIWKKSKIQFFNKGLRTA
ncbi:helix-turn-helix transcriptional regulator [Fulvivirga lutea]|uniref:Helix-turn-helix transcriptional regulator n=2 Tax=Fulvivirga lutea TaxID=2810512 RepID=A0A974WJ22_9BACT|nr:helix-turn-helix transcriptional regulator [Fulvivirga lutea]